MHSALTTNEAATNLSSRHTLMEKKRKFMIALKSAWSQIRTV